MPQVLQALQQIGRRERREGETSLPSLGMVLRVMGELAEPQHKLFHLRQIVRRLCAVFNQEPSEDLLKAFEDVAGHRTDSDLDAAYKAILRDETLKRMPTTGQFLQSCGTLRERRKP